jgi:hypothetical protein
MLKKKDQYNRSNDCAFQGYYSIEKGFSIRRFPGKRDQRLFFILGTDYGVIYITQYTKNFATSVFTFNWSRKKIHMLILMEENYYFIRRKQKYCY